MAKNITVNAAGHEDWLDAMAKELNDEALKRQCSKVEALKAVFDAAKGNQKPVFENTQEIEELRGKIAEYETKINELNETNHRLADSVAKLQAHGGINENLKKWIMPANMGAVCLALIMDESPDFAHIKDVDSACAFILEPYYRVGKFIADEADLHNYQNALEHGISKE